MRQTAVYRKTKPVYEGLKKAKKPEQYREQYRADLTLYEAAVRHFREQGLTKLPAVSRLQADNEAMISEKNSLYTDYRAQKAKAAELQKSNQPCRHSPAGTDKGETAGFRPLKTAPK